MAEAEIVVDERDRIGERRRLAAVAGRRADHRAGAQHRAVSRHGAADHARPAALDRGRAAGGARAAPGRHPDAAQRRGRRPDRRSTCTASARSPTSCATSPRRTARTISSARASSASRSPNSSSGWPFLVARVAAHPGARRAHARRSRRASSTCKRQALEALAAAAAGAAPNCWRPIQAIDVAGALADLVAAYMDVTPDEKQEILETVDIAARMDKVSRLLGASHRGAAALAGDRPADQGRRSTSASARCCCASRWRRSRRQLGEGEEGKAAEIAELDKAITKAGMPKEVEDAGAQGAAPAAAHARGGRPNTAWCAPISTG